MNVHPIVVLDVGATKVACAIGLPNARTPGFELLGTSLVAFPTLNETQWPDPVELAGVIDQAIESTGVSAEISRAHVVFTHAQLQSERVQVSIALADEPMAVRTQDLERLQAAALHQALAVDREALLVEQLGCCGNGFEMVRDPRGLPATRLLGQFHILTMPLSVRRMLAQALEVCGLEMEDIAYSLRSAFAGVVDIGALRKRILVIDVGGLTTDIGLVVDGSLQAATVVGRGGTTLAHTIARNCQVTLEQALAWSLEGAACSKPEAAALIRGEWEKLEQPITRLLERQPKPDAAIVCGRAGLVDGFVEWLERTTCIPTTLGRHPRAHRFGELARQVGLSTALGRLELATASRTGSSQSNPRLLNRVLSRTKAVLAEYF